MIGLEALLANMARLGAQIEGPATAEGLMDAATAIKDAWVGDIEGDDLILTGHYRDSVTIHEHGPDLVSISSDVPYARFLEFGTSRQAAHYVATRSVDENHDAAVDAVRKRIEVVLR